MDAISSIDLQQIPVTIAVRVARDHEDKDDCFALECVFPDGNTLTAIEVDPDKGDLAKVLGAFLNRPDVVATLIADLNAESIWTFDYDSGPRYKGADGTCPVKLVQIPIYATDRITDGEPETWSSLECRFSNDEKYGAIEIHPDYQHLTVLLYSFLNRSDLVSQVIVGMRVGEAIN